MTGQPGVAEVAGSESFLPPSISNFSSTENLNHGLHGSMESGPAKGCEGRGTRHNNNLDSSLSLGLEDLRTLSVTQLPYPASWELFSHNRGEFLEPSNFHFEKHAQAESSKRGKVMRVRQQAHQYREACTSNEKAACPDPKTPNLVLSQKSPSYSRAATEQERATELSD